MEYSSSDSVCWVYYWLQFGYLVLQFQEDAGEERVLVDQEALKKGSEDIAAVIRDIRSKWYNIFILYFCGHSFVGSAYFLLLFSAHDCAFADNYADSSFFVRLLVCLEEDVVELDMQFDF